MTTDKPSRIGRNRIWRRWRLLRQRDRARRWLWRHPADPPEESTIIHFGVDRQPCSCYMCGNPRRHSERGKDSHTDRRRDLEVTQ